MLSFVDSFEDCSFVFLSRRRHTRFDCDWSSDVCSFFFTSRRRHTRFDCDWSSDVCSSDLILSSRRERSTSMALILFWSWLFWSWHWTTRLVGRWVMRTALSVVLTLWPPGP